MKILMTALLFMTTIFAQIKVGDAFPKAYIG